DEEFIVKSAKQRPEKVGRPFSHWSVRKLREYLENNSVRKVVIGRERLRQILDLHEVTFQRTKTWKESNDPLKEAKLDRIEEVITRWPDRVFAFDEFGPLAIHPVKGCCWAAKKKPQRLRANYHKHCGTRQFHACYSLGEDKLWGVVRPQERDRLQPGRDQKLPGCTPRRRVDLRHLGQPEPSQERENPHLVREEQCRVVLHAYIRLMGEPDRMPLRLAAGLRVEQL